MADEPLSDAEWRPFAKAIGIDPDTGESTDEPPLFDCEADAVAGDVEASRRIIESNKRRRADPLFNPMSDEDVALIAETAGLDPAGVRTIVTLAECHAREQLADD